MDNQKTPEAQEVWSAPWHATVRRAVAWAAAEACGRSARCGNKIASHHVGAGLAAAAPCLLRVPAPQGRGGHVWLIT
ncbi:MAG: hypothetical protein M3308_01720 [Actinomycetota bacterium]|nr:hypothetical protein [Actinomycetota bacterium]